MLCEGVGVRLGRVLWVCICAQELQRLKNKRCLRKWARERGNKLQENNERKSEKARGREGGWMENDENRKRIDTRERERGRERNRMRLVTCFSHAVYTSLFLYISLPRLCCCCFFPPLAIFFFTFLHLCLFFMCVMSFIMHLVSLSQNSCSVTTG